MAFTKNEKSKMMEQYGEWLDKSQAMFMLTYDKMNMPTIDAIRSKIREAGGEAHVAKNTLLTKTLADKEYPAGEELTGTTLVNFAFNDAAAVAKAAIETGVARIEADPEEIRRRTAERTAKVREAMKKLGGN